MLYDGEDSEAEFSVSMIRRFLENAWSTLVTWGAEAHDQNPLLWEFWNGAAERSALTK